MSGTAGDPRSDIHRANSSTVPMALQVPPEGIRAFARHEYSGYVLDAMAKDHLRDALTAFLSAIQPRQARAMEAMRKAKPCALSRS